MGQLKLNQHGKLESIGRPCRPITSIIENYDNDNDDDDVTSYTSSNHSSETKLIKSSQHRTKSRRSISADTRSDMNDHKSNRSKQSVINNNNQISSLMNRRQYIVKPIVGTNNIRNYYQNDYYSYSDSYENDHDGIMNDKMMGKKRLITTLQHGNETDNYVPKAQEDNFPDRSFSIINEKNQLINSNGLISSDQENGKRMLLLLLMRM
ncbi:unnamed protein product [Schistosoma margrebowiei]|uniref:Uncharacterized protein n=1 Tax=Schistosoma margrebowiei TaxID=48269 RepID=A0A183L9R0_9TREM|nr:unnamed protein product [Schistosoma margrebowiei]